MNKVTVSNICMLLSKSVANVNIIENPKEFKRYIFKHYTIYISNIDVHLHNNKLFIKQCQELLFKHNNILSTAHNHIPVLIKK